MCIRDSLNEAASLWLHVLGFLPFLHEQSGHCNVGTVLQRAHNVFEAAAAAVHPEQHSALELEFDPVLLAAALQIAVPTEHISASYEYEENSGMAMNSLPELPQHGKSLEVQQAQEFDHLQRTTVESCLLYTSPSPRDATLSRMPSSA